MIEVKNLKKSYGNIKAVNGVSFTVNSGHVVGLLGPNGAGKTTTLNLITGVLLPDEGEIIIDDTPLATNLHALQKNIGYLAENNPLYNYMLVSELLEFTARLKGIERSAYYRELPKIVRATGIKDIFYREISTLSKGLRQRVGVAQALLGSPKILILDEPTEGLDPNQRQEIRDLIVDMAKERTVLMSTHVMQEVEAICEEVIILNHGEVVASGRVDEITQAKEGRVSIEMLFNKDAKALADKLKERFKDSIEVTDIKHNSFVADIVSDKKDDLFKAVSSLTNEDVYLTNMQVSQLELEEVFSKLTKAS